MLSPGIDWLQPTCTLKYDGRARQLWDSRSQAERKTYSLRLVQHCMAGGQHTPSGTQMHLDVNEALDMSGGKTRARPSASVVSAAAAQGTGAHSASSAVQWPSAHPDPQPSHRHISAPAAGGHIWDPVCMPLEKIANEQCNCC